MDAARCRHSETFWYSPAMSTKRYQVCALCGMTRYRRRSQRAPWSRWVTPLFPHLFPPVEDPKKEE